MELEVNLGTSTVFSASFDVENCPNLDDKLLDAIVATFSRRVTFRERIFVCFRPRAAIRFIFMHGDDVFLLIIKDAK